MTKDEFDIPQGQLLFSAPTDEHNGTLIRIPIKNYDISNFVSEVGKQLCYVDNLYVDDDDAKYWNHDVNDFVILRGKEWLYRPSGTPFSTMHICLDRITYTIDWTELNMPGIEFPIALKFNTGELIPTPSRESIVYTDKAKDLIKDKIDKVREDFTNMYQDQLEPTSDVNEYLSNIGNVISDLSLDGYTINVERIINRGVSSIKFKPFDDIGYKPSKYWEPFDKIFTVIGEIQGHNGRVNNATYYNRRMVSNHSLQNDLFLKVERGNHIEHKNACYILESFYDCKTVKLIRRNKVGLKKFVEILGLKYLSRDKWMPIIRTYCEHFIPYVESKIHSKYSDHLMHPNWEKTYAAGKSKYSPVKTVRKKNEISVTRYNPFSESMQRGTLYLNNLPKQLIYSSYDDRNNMVKLGKMLSHTGVFHQLKAVRRMDMVVVSKENLKYMNNIENALSTDEVISGDYKTFRKIITAYMIYERYQNVKYMEGIPETVNFSMKSKALELKEFMRKYGDKINKYAGLSSGDSFVMDCVAIATANNIFDQHMIDSLIELEAYCDGLEILSYTNITLVPDAVLTKFLKDNSKRIDNYNYLNSNGKDEILKKLENGL